LGPDRHNGPSRYWRELFPPRSLGTYSEGVTLCCSIRKSTPRTNIKNKAIENIVRQLLGLFLVNERKESEGKKIHGLPMRTGI
jgi:hypothetical protein